MILGLFRRKPKLVKVKRAKKVKKTNTAKRKKVKLKKPKLKAKKKVAKPKVKESKSRKAAQAQKAVKTKGGFPQIVGKVTHYFPRVSAGVILITDGNLKRGDTVQIKGHTTDFKQKVTSMQINSVPIEEARPGDEIGLLVKKHVRDNDIVYKL